MIEWDLDECVIVQDSRGGIIMGLTSFFHVYMALSSSWVLSLTLPDKPKGLKSNNFAF